uniref:Uncharacterized protein n=1 Tax=Naja naja TaxID=35670 RepID=A0A8C6VPI2_NAJNA
MFAGARGVVGFKLPFAIDRWGFCQCRQCSSNVPDIWLLLLLLLPFFWDLLFSICGLTIFSIVVCTLSAIMCCLQIFSVDVLQLSPPRSSSVTLDCTSPPDTFLQHMLDLDEFVPPVPPPPYYPPEYTCSSETDAISITYNGSMDSPVPLYPTDFPPSYEAVMGLRGDSQVWLDSLFLWGWRGQSEVVYQLLKYFSGLYRVANRKGGGEEQCGSLQTKSAFHQCLQR